jgi:hypothetical protein
MRFCLQCGASVAPTTFADTHVGEEDDAPFPPAPVAAPRRPPRTALSTINLKIAPTPVMSPRASPARLQRPSLGDNLVEVDEELLRKAFQRPLPKPGAVVCRFCKGPLDLAGDYCEHCGAPVAEAAPPGALPLKPRPEAPLASSPVPPIPLFSAPAKPAVPAAPPVANVAAPLSSPPPPQSPKPFTDIDLMPTATAAPPLPPPQELPAGFVGRLKGLFKKG